MSTPTISAIPNIRSRTALSGTRTRTQIVVPELRIADGPSATVLRIARSRGPLSRDTAAKASGLSIATVNRQVTSLLDLGILRERADLTASGAIGRPRVPFEVNHEPYLTVGIHIGAVVTSIIASDIRGKVLGAVEIPTPATNSAVALATIARSAKSFASRWHKRRPLAVGVAIGGRVDSATGVVDHPRLGWKGAKVGSIIGAGLDLPYQSPPTSRRWLRRNFCSAPTVPRPRRRVLPGCTSTPVKLPVSQSLSKVECTRRPADPVRSRTFRRVRPHGAPAAPWVALKQRSVTAP